MEVPKGLYKKFKDSLHVFLGHLHQEEDETKEAFKLLISSIETGKELTPEEKHQIGEQLKDVLKTAGLVGIAILPGGTVFFILAKFFKLNKYILPSSFEETKK
jgi:nucleoside recognition membrane protein YjiH